MSGRTTASTQGVLKGAMVAAAVVAIGAPSAVAQAPNPQGQQAQQPQQPQIQVQQPAPEIKVQQPKPEITVTQPPPQVTVEQPKPDVKVQQQEPQVKVEQTGQPQIRVEQQQGATAGQAQGDQQLLQMGRGIVGKTIYSQNDENIGEVEDVVMGANSQVQSALIDVGGFLGIGERRVAVPISDLRLDGDRLRTSMTRQQVEQLPEHERGTGTTSSGSSE